MTTPRSAPVDAASRSHAGTAAILLAIATAFVPALTLLVGWLTSHPSDAEREAALLALLIVGIVSAVLGLCAGIAALVFTVRAISRGGAERLRGVIAAVILLVAVALVALQVVLYTA